MIFPRNGRQNSRDCCHQISFARTVQTTDAEIIEVKFQEIDGIEKVLLVERAEGEAA